MRNTPTPPPPPSDLADHGRAYWQAVTAEFSLEAHHLVLLHQAAVQLDAAAEARAFMAAEGRFVAGKGGKAVEHPAAASERAAVRMFRSLQRELGLDIEPVDAGYSRPPSLATHGPSGRAK